jgi:hypothetical protein
MEMDNEDETTDTAHLENALAHLLAARHHMSIVALRCSRRDEQQARMRRARANAKRSEDALLSQSASLPDFRRRAS